MRRRIMTSLAIVVLSSTAAWGQGMLLRGNPQRDAAMPHYKSGVEQLRSEAWDKAAEAFQRAIDADATFEMAYYALGKTNMARKRYVEATTALAKCRDLYMAEAGRLFANQQDAQRYRQDRITELDGFIRQYSSGPQTAQSAEQLRQLNERKRQQQDAIQRGTNMSIDTSVPAYVSLSLGSAYFRLGRMAEAEKEYKAAVASDPKTGEAHSNLAVVYMETGRIDEAARAVQAAEKAGFKVNPMLKDDIAAKKKAGSN